MFFLNAQNSHLNSTCRFIGVILHDINWIKSEDKLLILFYNKNKKIKHLNDFHILIYTENNIGTVGRGRGGLNSFASRLNSGVARTWVIFLGPYIVGTYSNYYISLDKGGHADLINSSNSV